MIGGKDMSATRSGGGAPGSSGAPTVAVVNLVLALRGDAMKRLGLDRSVSSMSGDKRNTLDPLRTAPAISGTSCL